MITATVTHNAPAKASRKASRKVPAKAGHNNPPRFSPEVQDRVFAYGKALAGRDVAAKSLKEAGATAEQTLLSLLVDPSVRNYAVPAKAKGGTIKVSMAQAKAIPDGVGASSFWDAMCMLFGIPAENRATFRAQVQTVLPVAVRLSENKCSVVLEGRQTRIVAPTRKASALAKAVASMGAAPFAKIAKAVNDKPVATRGARRGTDKAKSMNLPGAAELLARGALEMSKLKGAPPSGAFLANIRTIIKYYGPFVQD